MSFAHLVHKSRVEFNYWIDEVALMLRPKAAGLPENLIEPVERACRGRYSTALGSRTGHKQRKMVV